jgi:hypothetical protein
MKTNLDGRFKTNKEDEKNGKWFDLDQEGTQGFCLRPMKASNPRTKAAMAAHYKPYARLIEIDALEPAKAREISVKIFIQICLVDWKGIEIDGEPAKCEPEAAFKLFMELPDLFDTLEKYANDFSNWKEDLGNC